MARTALVHRCCGIATLLVALAAHTTAAAELRLGLITPPAHLWTEAAYRFSDAVAALDPAGARVAVYPSRQLGNEAQMLQLLQTGALDFAILTVSELSNRLADFSVFHTPYLTRDAQEAADLLATPAAQKLLATLPERLGIVGLGYTMAGMRQILVNRPVEDAAALGGLKLRITPSPPVRDFYRLLGAAPTPMPLSAVFDALANGQIDAIDMDLESIVKLRYHEYANTLLLSNHMMFPAVGVVSGRTWRRLDPEQQVAIGGLFREQLAWINTQYPAREQEWLASLAAKGVDIRAVGQDFFPGIDTAWLGIWQSRTPDYKSLKLAIEGFRDEDRANDEPF